MTSTMTKKKLPVAPVKVKLRDTSREPNSGPVYRTPVHELKFMPELCAYLRKSGPVRHKMIVKFFEAAGHSFGYISSRVHQAYHSGVILKNEQGLYIHNPEIPVVPVESRK